MRIVCPRCVAQYEVDESIITEIGREVQCAECENIWFQDFVEMLPTAESINSSKDKDRQISGNIDDKAEASFHSKRRMTIDLEESVDDAFDDNDIGTANEGHQDDAPETSITTPPVIEEVVEILRSEAVFSSARNQVNVVVADKLSNDEPEREFGEPTPTTMYEMEVDRVVSGIKDNDQHHTDRAVGKIMADVVNTLEDKKGDVANEIDPPGIKENMAAALDTGQKADPNPDAHINNKVISPNVKEHDVSTRSEEDERHHRDTKMAKDKEDDATNMSEGSFQQAFIWTLLIIALLIIIYVFHPQLVAALPPTAMVLDPYANAIDHIRVMINDSGY